MLALAAAVFAGAASMRCLDALLPMLAADFGRSIGFAGGTVSAYALSYGFFQLLYGPLGDRYGAYRMVAAATCLSALGAAACACATSLEALVALRFVAGATAAGIGPLTLAWVSRSLPGDQRPLALARMTAAAIGGTAAGQAGGGLLGDVAGWQGVFVALMLVFATSGLALILLARRRPALLRHGSPATLEEQRRSGHISLLGRPAVRRVLAAVGVQGVAIHLSLAYAGALIHDRLAVGPTRSGLLVALYGLGGLVFVLSAPLLLRVSNTRARATAGGAVLGVGFLSLGMSGSQASAAASLFAVGFGFLLLHNVLQVMATDMAPDALGRSLALFAAASVLAQAIGASLGGFLYDRIGPTALCLLSAAVLTALGGVIALSRGASPDDHLLRPDE